VKGEARSHIEYEGGYAAMLVCRLLSTQNNRVLDFDFTPKGAGFDSFDLPDDRSTKPTSTTCKCTMATMAIFSLHIQILGGGPIGVCRLLCHIGVRQRPKCSRIRRWDPLQIVHSMRHSPAFRTLTKTLIIFNKIICNLHLYHSTKLRFSIDLYC
jgi:hypothetical protein